MQQQTSTLLEPVYTEEELASLDPRSIPHHVAVIMDGNRRWAVQHSYPVSAGHFKGADQLDPIVRAAAAIGVRVLTVYAFSTENWGRSQLEVAFLMQIFETYLKKKRKQLVQEGVRLQAIGNLDQVPSAVQRELHRAITATEQGEKIDLVLAINYGGRDEICRGIKKMAQAEKRGEIDFDALTEKEIARFLDTVAWPDPELLIRTSGEKRMSNFLTWQTTYSEIVVSDVLWPDFSQKHFLSAIIEYQQRRRRFGG
ncbi:MAG: polyprenyl diphosphate synthase [Chlamydiota bacterium]